MKVLVTGGNGFLGKHIVRTFFKSDDVSTLSRTGADILCDLSKSVPSLGSFDLVIHCCGKAHSIPLNLEQEKVFFDVNVTGTVNLLKALDASLSLPKYLVFISSVSVYGIEAGVSINEEHPLLAKDAYGLSKIEAEKLVVEWCNRNFVVSTILRLPLLAGVNPPGNLGSMINGIKRGYYVNIAKGKARKSMVLATDVAGIIHVAAKCGGIYNLTDGEHPSFNDLSELIANELRVRKPFNAPIWLIKFLARIGDHLGANFPINTTRFNKIVSDLTFDDSKAIKNLNWSPNRVLRKLKLTCSDASQNIDEQTN